MKKEEKPVVAILVIRIQNKAAKQVCVVMLIRVRDRIKLLNFLQWESMWCL